MNKDKHIVKSYDHELDSLRIQIAQMGDVTKSQIEDALNSLIRGDLKTAQMVIDRDKRVNQLQHNIDRLIVNMLAKRQPLASDLRVIIASQWITTDLERISDYAVNIATHSMNIFNETKSLPISLVEDMARCAIQMLTDILQAYDANDQNSVKSVWKADQKINTGFSALIEELSQLMINDQKGIQTYTDMLFIGRSCERIGDHIKNIAEHLFYMITGDNFCTE